MLEQAVQNIINRVITQECPHLELPAVLYAQVVSARELEDRWELPDLVIYSDEGGGGSYRGHITAPWYEYELCIMDRFGNRDGAYPPIPQVRSRQQLPIGAVAAVALPYGELSPVILGEVRL